MRHSDAGSIIDEHTDGQNSDGLEHDITAQVPDEPVMITLKDVRSGYQ
jgi:hypothetical protein